jgi:protoporphyrinogen oxidase
MAQIVILGAGLTGLSTAYHLEKRGFFDYLLFEKDATVGGLCRSVQQDGFTFDYTGHLLHASDPYFRQFIGETAGYETLNSITRRSFIYSHNTYTKYPYQMNLFGLPLSVITECIAGFAQRPLGKKASNFHDWVLYNFGSGIAQHFFFPFQRKIFAYKNLKQIATTWMGRFVPNTSLEQLITGAIQQPTEETSIGYNAHFYYPKQGGINSWITTIAQQLTRPIQTDYEVGSIDMTNKMVFFTNGAHQRYDTLITTIPLDILTRLIKEHAAVNMRSAGPQLLCNSVVNFNLGIARPHVSTKHWIYFPENRYPFYRIGFPHNFASHMVPDGCSSLYGEFSHINGSSRLLKQKLNIALEQTKELFAIRDEEIITKTIIPIRHAYVLYTPWRERYLPRLHARLNEHDIYSIGRYGEWKYSSMQEAVLDGKRMAEQLTLQPAQRESFQTAVVTPRQISQEV